VCVCVCFLFLRVLVIDPWVVCRVSMQINKNIIGLNYHHNHHHLVRHWEWNFAFIKHVSGRTMPHTILLQGPRYSFYINGGFVISGVEPLGYIMRGLIRQLTSRPNAQELLTVKYRSQKMRSVQPLYMICAWGAIPSFLKQYLDDLTAGPMKIAPGCDVVQSGRSSQACRRNSYIFTVFRVAQQWESENKFENWVRFAQEL
jgi:hypothetical protein